MDRQRFGSPCCFPKRHFALCVACFDFVDCANGKAHVGTIRLALQIFCLTFCVFAQHLRLRTCVQRQFRGWKTPRVRVRKTFHLYMQSDKLPIEPASLLITPFWSQLHILSKMDRQHLHNRFRRLPENHERRLQRHAGHEPVAGEDPDAVQRVDQSR